MPARQNLGMDLSSGGDWLFKDGELVLGPVHAYQVVEKLYTGELNGRTQVSPMGEHSFRPIAETAFFKVHLAKAEAKLRVEATAREEQSKARRKRAVLMGAVAAVTIVVAAGAAVVARYLAVHNPFKDDDAFAEGIQIEPPKITLARAQPRNQEELLAYDGPRKPGLTGSGTSSTGTQEKPGTSRPGATASRTTRPGGAAGSASKPSGTVSEDPDGLETAQFDQDAINAVVASNQRKLFVCFREEAQRNPGFAARIPMEFVIGNGGKVTKLWIDNPSYKQGALADCLLRELQKWPFKTFEGESPTVSLSFTIGKPRG